MALGYVPDDGYTEVGILAEVPHLSPRLRFSFRRMTADEYAQHLQDCETLRETEVHRLVGARLVGHVLSWDLRDGKGQPVRIELETVGRLVRTLYVRLWKVVAGLEAPDQVEGRTVVEAQVSLEDKIRAASQRRPLPEVADEGQVKNS